MGRKLSHSIKNILRPIYYSYMGRKLFNAFEWLSGYKIEKRRFFKALGYYPDLKNPRSFNEKILWKKIYDRNPLLPVITDKYLVRQYLKDTLGQKQADKILVPLFFVTDNPKTIPFDSLTQEYIIKPNHESGKLILAEDTGQKRRYTVKEGQEIDIFFDCEESREKIIKICSRWLSMTHGFYKHEWAYQKIKRKIIIEKLIRGTNRKMPNDYRLHIFHGKCRYIVIVYDRFNDKSVAHYTPEWERVNVMVRTKQAIYREKPKNLKSMIELAELLGKPFDYIRVDIHSVDCQIYFGELTNYTYSGAIPYKPQSIDFKLGSYWKVVPGYWIYSR